MLVSQNNFDKSESKYECDRCKKELSIETRICILAKTAYGNPKKQWDLCNTCYKMLHKGIAKGVK